MSFAPSNAAVDFQTNHQNVDSLPRVARNAERRDEWPSLDLGAQCQTTHRYQLRNEIFKGQGRKAVMITTLSAFDRMDVLRHGIHRRPPSTYSPLDFTRGVT